LADSPVEMVVGPEGDQVLPEFTKVAAGVGEGVLVMVGVPGVGVGAAGPEGPESPLQD
jgi:hypothetical protein